MKECTKENKINLLVSDPIFSKDREVLRKVNINFMWNAVTKTTQDIFYIKNDIIFISLPWKT